MSHLIAEFVRADVKKRNFPVEVGHKVRVAQRIQEGNKERIQNFDGVVIAVHGSDKTMDGTFTVRAIIDSIGVEKIFPFHCPTVESVKVLGKARIRRSKLYYLRQRSGKSARLRYDELALLLSDEKDAPKEEAEEDIVETEEENNVVEEIKEEEKEIEETDKEKDSPEDESEDKSKDKNEA